MIKIQEYSNFEANGPIKFVQNTFSGCLIDEIIIGGV
jgi:hypothetical protein